MDPSKTDLAVLLADAFNLRYFHAEGGEPPVIPFHHTPGKVPLVAVVGPNAGGKSFFRRIVQQVCAHREPKIECMGISMQFRTEANNPFKAFVFGDETWQATGEISGHTVLTGINTCASRDNPHVIFWDEPDLGLSDGYSGGMGQTLARFAQNLPTHTVGAFVVTHSRALLRQLLPVEPHYVHLGSENPPESLQAWLDTEAPVLPQEDLKEASYARFRRIQKILQEVRKDFLQGVRKGPR